VKAGGASMADSGAYQRQLLNRWFQAENCCWLIPFRTAVSMDERIRWTILCIESTHCQLVRVSG